MTRPLYYQPSVPDPRPLWWPAAIATALILVIGACAAWSTATPALGERTLSPTKIWMARLAAISLGSAAQAMLVGVALPAIYRSRPIYAGLTALASLAAVLAGVSAAALWLSGR